MKKIQHYFLVNLLLLCIFSLTHVTAYASYSNDKITASGPDVTETRKTAAFSKLEVSNAIEVIYTVGKQTKVSVTAPQSIMPYVRTEVKGNTLKCYIKTDNNYNINFNNHKVVMNITAPAICDFDLSGASSVKVTNELTGLSELEIDLSGASKMTVGTIKVSKLEIDLSGASNLDITSAAVTKADIDISGASNLEIDKAAANRMDIECSGASKADIAGKVQYCSIDVSGASSANLSNLIFADGSVEASGASKLTLNKNSVASSMESSGGASVKKK